MCVVEKLLLNYCFYQLIMIRDHLKLKNECNEVDLLSDQQSKKAL